MQREQPPETAELGGTAEVELKGLVFRPRMCDPLVPQFCICAGDDGSTKVARINCSHDGECGGVPMAMDRKEKDMVMVGY